jgi:hypothetical protein
MAVHYTGGGGGLLGSLLGAATMFVPGLQPYAPYIFGANALMNGDVGGAIGSIAGPMAGRMIDASNVTAARNAANQESLFGALTSANQGTAPATHWDRFTDSLDKTEFQRRWGR